MIWLISIYIIYLKIELPYYYVKPLIWTPQEYFIRIYGDSALINRKHVINVKEYLFFQQVTYNYKSDFSFYV